MVKRAHVYGMPAYSCAMRATLAPPPGGRTLPTATSLFDISTSPLHAPPCLIFSTPGQSRVRR